MCRIDNIFVCRSPWYWYINDESATVYSINEWSHTAYRAHWMCPAQPNAYLELQNVLRNIDGAQKIVSKHSQIAHTLALPNGSFLLFLPIHRVQMVALRPKNSIFLTENVDEFLCERWTIMQRTSEFVIFHSQLEILFNENPHFYVHLMVAAGSW